MYGTLVERICFFMVTLPTLRDLLDHGVHFGHKTARWHPKMAPFIFVSKNGVSVINLEKTVEQLEKATAELRKLASEGKTIVFVGTKRQAQEIVKKAALSCGMPYVNFRWVGGMLTNFDNIKVAISKFKKQKEELESGKLDDLSKKELSRIRKDVQRGERVFGGLTALEKKPDAFILLGAHDEKNALKEAILLKTTIIALVDTNVDPTGIDFPVPGNDDATKSIELFANLFSAVIRESKGVAKAQEQK